MGTVDNPDGSRYGASVVTDDDRAIADFLSGHVTPRRLDRMEDVLSERTRYIAVVLEDIFQAQNASAVLRHCDALGIQEVHVIENRNTFRTDDEVALGTAQWLDIHRYRGESDNTGSALRSLRERGYRIIATGPEPGFDTTPENLDLAAGPVALVFGNEKTGVSATLRKEADLFLRIPMVGFVDSLNLSASAAIAIYVLSRRLRENGPDGRLDDGDREATRLRWLRSTVSHASELEREYRRRRNDEPGV